MATAASAAASVGWKELLCTSLKKNKSLRNATYVQVATVRPNGRPANRTVVFRGFLWDTERLTFVTDTRSDKVEEVAGNPYCEVAWYFPNSREQYRIQGTLDIIGASCDDSKLAKARVSAWKNMSDAGRTQFAWPQPGLPRPDPEDKSPYDLPPPPADGPVLDAFSLVVLDPYAVDYLSLKGNLRKSFQRGEAADGGAGGLPWSEVDINP
eukprot:CAMPEP_0177761372 /NCGR_PEP_ID=MMETSP0491_2-20121128/5768_1 /TAXON_ID=63592 /ORGANISM="Tetraselmis chuii, Strain PLY429" /LENGTH=209 /DNA_ID=CAMNT_0019277339 /DNA_START=33 /DNA_END=662 /DNA_ORIENTATION=-